MTPADIVTILGGLGSAAGTVYGCYKLIIKPTFAILRKLKTSFEILEKMQEEFKPNGGSSLRDAINRIETKLLIEQHARRAMSMAMDMGVFETDGNGLCTWINEFYSGLTGISIDEAKGFGWITGVYEGDRERVTDEWTSAVKQQRIFRLEFGMFNSKTQEYSKVYCTAFPVINHVGPRPRAAAGFIGVVTKASKELIRPKYIASA